MVLLSLSRAVYKTAKKNKQTAFLYYRKAEPAVNKSVSWFDVNLISMFFLCAIGAGLSGRQMHRTQGVFNHTEDYVLLPDERTISLCCWDSRTAERKNLLSLGHNNIVRCIVHSPTNPGFMTCSDDFRARFWYRRTTTDWDTPSLHDSTLLPLLHYLVSVLLTTRQDVGL